MYHAVIYCPVADAFATVTREGRWYVVALGAERRWFRDELEAIGWAERALTRRVA